VESPLEAQVEEPVPGAVPEELTVTEPEAPEVKEDGLDRARLGSIARDIASHLLPNLEVEAAIEWVDEDRPTMWISLEGKDADSLVGPRARNLHAVQYLFRSLIYHELDGEYNVVVDADGYRKRRRRSIESLAEEKAARALELGRTVRLRPMPAHERRIVHITLRKDDRVSTESVGRGRDRAVTIIPTNSGGRSGKS
jgi:spoIIIJ-associated protein